MGCRHSSPDHPPARRAPAEGQLRGTASTRASLPFVHHQGNCTGALDAHTKVATPPTGTTSTEGSAELELTTRSPSWVPQWDLLLTDLSMDHHIANGGYCTVLACQLHGKRAAIKMPRADCSNPEGGIADLNNEIAILKRLSRHPHLTTVYGAGGTRAGGMPFLVLERLQTTNLCQQLGTDAADAHVLACVRTQRVRKRFPFRRRLDLGLQLVLLLRYLHREAVPNGFVVHR